MIADYLPLRNISNLGAESGATVETHLLLIRNYTVCAELALLVRGLGGIKGLDDTGMGGLAPASLAVLPSEGLGESLRVSG